MVILLTLLAIIAFAIIGAIVLAGVGGITIILAFGDLIVFIAIIWLFMKMIKKVSKKD